MANLSSLREEFVFAPEAVGGPVSTLFFQEYCKQAGFPPDTKTDAQVFICVCQPKSNGVYCVFGFKQQGDVTLVTDFYVWPSFLGKKAAYAAMLYIKEAADTFGLTLAIMTPISNERMQRAITHVFGVLPSHVIMSYNSRHGSSSGPSPSGGESRLSQPGQERPEGS